MDDLAKMIPPLVKGKGVVGGVEEINCGALLLHTTYDVGAPEFLGL